MKKFLGLLIVYIVFVSNVLAKDVKFIQITDLRYSKQTNQEVFDNLISDIKKQKDIDFVVFTGDNINSPDMKQLKDFVSKVKKIHKPVYVIAGDKEVNKYKDISKKDYAKYLNKKLINPRTGNFNYTFEKSGMLFVVADGAKDVIPGPSGYYKDDVVEWVDSVVDLHSDKNIVILQHFPLLPPEGSESYTTFKAKNYLEALEKHPNVKAVVSGHFGYNKEENINGITHIITAPAPSYRIIEILDCTSDNPTIWAEVKDAAPVIKKD